MPKAAQPELVLPSGTTQGPLKRNQACHRCRRRKLKCDAQRPCSGCIKAKAHAEATGKDTSQLECIYDEVPDTGAPHEPLKRYKRLEGRITELESLLKEKDDAMQQLLTALQQHSISPIVAKPSNDPQPLTVDPVDPLSYFLPETIPSTIPTTPSVSQFGQNFLSFDQLHPPPTEPATLLFQPDTPPLSFGSHSSPSASASPGKSATDSTSVSAAQSPQADPMTEVLFLGWPSRLPSPDLLLHLVEIFFVSHPHAPRLLHRTSFMASLSLPPTHPEFPDRSLLHAICAFSSYFSKAVEGPEIPDLTVRPAEEIFQEKGRRTMGRQETFGELQARWAMEAQDDNCVLGEHLMEGLQSSCVLAWFYYYSARWFELWLVTGRTVRYSVPLGLSTTATHGPLLRSYKPPSIIPPPATTIEAETRRNVFWLAYALERWQTASSGWSTTLADDDISQVMPVTASDFDLGVRIPMEERQRIHSPRMLTTHPEDQTDSFTLYVKGTIIISMIKTFGIRFKTRYFASLPPSTSVDVLFTPFEDPETTWLPDAEKWAPKNPTRVDPRESPGFKSLDTLVSAFALSFPKHLREPIVNGIVDPDLFVANLIPHVATIILHDSFAQPELSTCQSAAKLLQAARNIMTLVYSVCSTSFDLALLHHNVSFSWFTAGRVLVRFLKAKLDAGETEEAQAIRGEVEVIRLALERFGERIPLGFRQAKMLNDLLTGALNNFQTFPTQMCEGIGSHGQPLRSATIEELTPLDVRLSASVAQDSPPNFQEI